MNSDVAVLAARLPTPAQLARWWVAMAAADRILSGGELGCYAFDPHWDEQEHFGSLDDGSGNEASVTFTAQGAFLRGFDHESPLSPWAREDEEIHPALLEGLPTALDEAAHDGSFHLDDMHNLTLALWWVDPERGWQFGADLDPEEDGGVWLFENVDGRPETYRAWAQDYYERDIDASLIAKIFDNEDLTDEEILRLNPEADLASTRQDLADLNFPIPPG